MEETLATAFDGGRNAIFAALLLLVLLHLHCDEALETLEWPGWQRFPLDTF